MKMLIIHGPNLNMLGYRAKNHYGTLTFSELETHIANEIRKYDLQAELYFFQSNSEGELIDQLHQSVLNSVDAIILNLGAYSHYSIALRDALEISQAIKVEVHLSDVYSRDDFRHRLLTNEVCDMLFAGKHEKSYSEAIEWLFSSL